MLPPDDKYVTLATELLRFGAAAIALWQLKVLQKKSQECGKAVVDKSFFKKEEHTATNLRMISTGESKKSSNFHNFHRRNWFAILKKCANATLRSNGCVLKNDSTALVFGKFQSGYPSLLKKSLENKEVEQGIRFAALLQDLGHSLSKQILVLNFDNLLERALF